MVVQWLTLNFSLPYNLLQMTHFPCTRHLRLLILAMLLYRNYLTQFCGNPAVLDFLLRAGTRLLSHIIPPSPPAPAPKQPHCASIKFTWDKTEVLALNSSTPDQRLPIEKVKANTSRRGRSKRPAPAGCLPDLAARDPTAPAAPAGTGAPPRGRGGSRASPASRAARRRSRADAAAPPGVTAPASPRPESAAFAVSL